MSPTQSLVQETPPPEKARSQSRSAASDSSSSAGGSTSPSSRKTADTAEPVTQPHTPLQTGSTGRAVFAPEGGTFAPHPVPPSGGRDVPRPRGVLQNQPEDEPSQASLAERRAATNQRLEQLRLEQLRQTQGDSSPAPAPAPATTTPVPAPPASSVHSPVVVNSPPAPVPAPARPDSARSDATQRGESTRLADENRRLADKVRDLTRELDDARRRGEDGARSVDELNRRIERMQRDHDDDLQRERRRKPDDDGEMAQEMARKEKRWADTYSQQTHEYEELARREKRLVEKSNQLTERVTQLTEKNAQLAASVEDFTKRERILREASTAREEELRRLWEDNRALQAELGARSAQLAASAGTNKELADERERRALSEISSEKYMRQAKSAEAELEVVKSEFMRFKAERPGDRGDRTDRSDRGRGNTADIQSLIQRAEEKAFEVEILKRELGDMNAKTMRYQETLAQREEQLAEAVREKNKRDAAPPVSARSSGMSELEREHQAMKEAQRHNELQRILKEVETLRQEHSKAVEERDRLVIENESLRAALKDTAPKEGRRRADSLTKKDSQEELKKAIEERRKLQLDVADLERVIESRDAEVRRLLEDQKRYLMAVEDAEKRADASSNNAERMAAKHRELANLADDYGRLLADYERLKKSAPSQAEIRDLREAHSLQSERIKEIESERDEARQALRERGDTGVRTVTLDKREMESLRGSLQVLQQEHNARMDENEQLRRQVAELRARGPADLSLPNNTASLEYELDRVQRDRNLLSEKLVALERDHDSVVETLERRTERYRLLAAKYEHLGAKFNALREKHGGSRSHKSDGGTTPRGKRERGSKEDEVAAEPLTPAT